MVGTVCLYRSDVLGFDLDTRRPYFPNPGVRDIYFADLTDGLRVMASNWNRIGDDILVGQPFDTVSQYDMGRAQMSQGGLWYYFRIRSTRVNEAGRTVIQYDIDWLLTYCPHFGNARLIRCPAGTPHAVATPVNQRRWECLSSSPVGPHGQYVALTLTQMSKNHDGNYDVKGPVFVLLDCNWTTMQSGVISGMDPIADFVSIGYCAPGDIVNAWAVPRFFELGDGNTRYWNTLGTGTKASLNAARYTPAAPLATVDKVVTVVPRVSDLSVGRIAGFCDERGNILYTVPDRMTTGAQLSFRLSMSMSTCEIDITLENEGFIKAHTCDRSFTLSCRPLDVVCDSWAEYAFRQRAADIEARRLQAEQALVGAGSSALSGAATGAMIGSVVPGAGTVAGAVLGGVAGVAMAGLQYGIDSLYAPAEQQLKDTASRLQQDTLSVTGGISAFVLASGYALYAFTLEVDAATKAELQARNAITGVEADGYTADLAGDMVAMWDEADTWEPWAAEVEVTEAMPYERKRAIQETMRAGARWYPYGTW